MEKILALLPIKQMSERVPGKNFRDLCGKPLYTWILETLLSCNTLDGVLVDTDSEELIENLHRDYPSVRTLLRPKEIRGNLVSMNRIIAHDISKCGEYSYFLQTHTTNPLLHAETIDAAVEKYFAELDKFDSAFSVNRIQARTYWGDGSPINHSLTELKRTQDLDPIYEENSNFFIFSRDSFAKTQSRLGERPLLLEIPRAESFEIDEEEDFLLIQQLIRGANNA